MYLVTPRLKKEGSCPAKSSYEQAKLENDVVARRILGFLAHCDGVVRLCDCDGKIALVQLLFEAFKGVLRCAENALCPGLYEELVVLKVILDCRAIGSASTEQMMNTWDD